MMPDTPTPVERRPLTRHRVFAGLRRNLGLLLRVIVTIGTLIIVINSVSFGAIARMVRGADFRWMALALIIFWLAQLASSQRFFFIARTLGSPVSFPFSARLHFIGLWFNQVFPSNIGGDVVKAIMLKPVMGLGLAVRTTILDRASGLIFLLASIVVLLPLYFRVLPQIQQTLALGLFSAMALSAIALLSWLADPISLYLVRIPAARNLITIFRSLWVFRRGRPLREQLWTSAIVHFNAIIAYALAGTALGLHVSMLNYILITPLVFLFALLPISLAGWGIRELGSVWLFGLVGVTAEQSSAMSVLFGLMLITAGIPGLFMLPSGFSLSARTNELNGKNNIQDDQIPASEKTPPIS